MLNLRKGRGEWFTSGAYAACNLEHGWDVIMVEGKEMTSASPRGFNSGGGKAGRLAARPVAGQPCEGQTPLPSEYQRSFDSAIDGHSTGLQSGVCRIGFGTNTFLGAPERW